MATRLLTPGRITHLDPADSVNAPWTLEFTSTPVDGDTQVIVAKTNDLGLVTFDGNGKDIFVPELGVSSPTFTRLWRISSLRLPCKQSVVKF